ncbi:hypothetical protein FBU30_006649 [Linnemannia zychae]|nr:hypothetical protein FBU30_006649 [Linnemannia zychae]
MAGCYSSSASAPLHALANQFLGESTFSAKSSLFRSTSSPRHQHYPGVGNHQQSGGLFPRQQQQHYAKHQITPSKQKIIEDNNTFEHAWSGPSIQQQQQELLHHHYQTDPWETQFIEATHQRPIPNQRHLHDLDLISSWDHATTTSSQRIVTNSSLQEFSPQEFDAFYYDLTQTSTTEDSLWAQEMANQTQKASTTFAASKQMEDEETDDEDEFREEWNNDHFTQAYINSHQSQFRQIEEQDRIKEARLAEERERQRASSGGPPRPSYSWMMTGVPSSSAAMDTVAAAAFASSSQRSLQPTTNNPSDFCVSEFESFAYNTGFTSAKEPTRSSEAVKPIRAQDRFISLVNDLHIAEQSYYPPASSATIPTERDFDLHVSAPQHSAPSNSAWAQEFTSTASAQHGQQTPKKFLGAEWNWEKMFGKDPRKQLEGTTVVESTTTATSEGLIVIDENERLRAVALARLQAVFKHLSLTPSPTASAPIN